MKSATGRTLSFKPFSGIRDVMSDDQQRPYTLAHWQVIPGEEAAFLAAWEALGKAFADLPGRPAPDGFLLQSLEDPSSFYSFGPWKDLKAIQAMRADPTAQAAMEKVRSHCVSASPGAYRLVRHLKTG